MNTDNLPIEPPATGGWYFDEKAQKTMFLMPPYPGVDDAVQTPAGLAYRKLAARDHHYELRAAMYDEYEAAQAVLGIMTRGISRASDEQIHRQARRCVELKDALSELDCVPAVSAEPPTK